MNNASLHGPNGDVPSLLEMKPTAVEGVLLRSGILAAEERLQAKKPIVEVFGGNMNCTTRVHTTERTLIVKQSFPYCYRYAQVSAPIERNAIESDFYMRTARDVRVARYHPRLLGNDSKQRILALDDFGFVSDYGDLYTGRQITDEQLAQICRYLELLHDSDQVHGVAPNFAMRRLNHTYLFALPLEFVDVRDLSDSEELSIQQVANTIRKNNDFVRTVQDLGAHYLTEEGQSLIHGDFYPRNWLRVGEELKIIDGEFAYPGSPDFDLGTLLAHLKLSNQDGKTIRKVESFYAGRVDWQRALQIAGVEIFRRTVGPAARIANERDRDAKAISLWLAERLVVDPRFALL